MSEKENLQKLLDTAETDPKLTPKQAKILEAAIEMFAEKGYAATSTSEIAKKAEVAEGTIFRHYKTKKELLMGIVTPMITKFAAPFFMSHFVNRIFKENHETYIDLLEALIYNRYEFVQNNSSLIKIVLQELAFHPEIQQTFQDTFREKVFPRMVQAINQFKEKEELVDYPAETIFRMTITTILGFLITRFIILPDYDWDDELEIKRTLEFLQKGLSPE